MTRELLKHAHVECASTPGSMSGNLIHYTPMRSSSSSVEDYLCWRRKFLDGYCDGGEIGRVRERMEMVRRGEGEDEVVGDFCD